LQIKQEQLQIEHEAAKPKVEVYDAIVASDELMQVAAVAKMHNYKVNSFRDWCKAYGIILQSGMPSAEMMNRGLMDYKNNYYTDVNGKVHVSSVPYFTPTGLIKIKEVVEKYIARRAQINLPSILKRDGCTC
jgi:phage antirepressor YoqD-like protein